MKDPLMGIVRAIRNALELSPPELAADILERGIIVAGGGSLLRASLYFFLFTTICLSQPSARYRPFDSRRSGNR